jgi:hypothetical protein
MFPPQRNNSCLVNPYYSVVGADDVKRERAQVPCAALESASVEAARGRGATGGWSLRLKGEKFARRNGLP